MKYYRIIFSDCSETVGKSKNIKDMRRDANRYCRMWNLTETISDIEEISEEEYLQNIR